MSDNQPTNLLAAIDLIITQIAADEEIKKPLAAWLVQKAQDLINEEKQDDTI